MTILVTGAGGFIGGAIARELMQRGHQVRSLARGEYPELATLGIEVMRGDLADAQTVLDAVEGCEAVFHVAAKAGQWGSYESYYQPNVVGTENIISACRTHNVGKLIFTSSPSVVDGGDAIEGADEHLPYPTKHVSYYSETKAISEKIVLAANDEQLSTVAIRPPLVWGVGDNNLMPRFIERAKRGRLFRIGRQPYLVDTTYIDNVVHAHLLAFDKLSPQRVIAGKAYFISNDEPRPVHEMIDALVATAGYPPAQRNIPPFIALTAASVIESVYRLRNTSKEPPMTRFVVGQLLKPRWFDISAAKRDLGYEVLVSIDEGLEHVRKALNTIPT